MFRFKSSVTTWKLLSTQPAAAPKLDDKILQASKTDGAEKESIATIELDQRSILQVAWSSNEMAGKIHNFPR